MTATKQIEYDWHEETVPVGDNEGEAPPYPPRETGDNWELVERVVIDRLVVYRWRRPKAPK